MEAEDKRQSEVEVARDYEEHDALLAASAKLVAEMQALLERAYALQKVGIRRTLNST